VREEWLREGGREGGIKEDSKGAKGRERG